MTRWGRGGARAFPASWRRAGTLRTGLRWFSSAVLLVFFLFPLYGLLVNALETPAEAEAAPVQLVPRHLYWGNFAALLHHFPFGRNLWNSLLVASSTTLLVLLLATGAAYALACLRLPGRRALLVLVVLLLCFPSIALVASLYLVLRATGWLNTYLAVIAPYCALWTPLAIWVLSGAFGQVPAELCAQAETDGCTALQVLGRVVLPLAAPAVGAAALLVFIGAWGEYLFALTFLFRPEMLPLSVVLEGVGVGHGVDSAAVVVVTAPLCVLVALAQSHLIRGLQAAVGH